MSRKTVVSIVALGFFFALATGLASAAGPAASITGDPQAQQAAPKRTVAAQQQAAVRLNAALRTVATQGVKRVALTPAIAPKGFGLRELESGQVVGVIETKSIDRVRDGKYNVFVAKVGGVWQAQFQSDGAIAATSKSVEVTEATAVKRPEIRFNLKIFISWDAKFIRIEL